MYTHFFDFIILYIYYNIIIILFILLVDFHSYFLKKQQRGIKELFQYNK